MTAIITTITPAIIPDMALPIDASSPCEVIRATCVSTIAKIADARLQFRSADKSVSPFFLSIKAFLIEMASSIKEKVAIAMATIKSYCSSIKYYSRKKSKKN